jgi:hypothetical protein
MVEKRTPPETVIIIEIASTIRQLPAMKTTRCMSKPVEISNWHMCALIEKVLL